MKALTRYIQWMITAVYFGIFYILGEMDFSQRYFERFMVLLLIISFLFAFLIAIADRKPDS